MGKSRILCLIAFDPAVDPSRTERGIQGFPRMTRIKSMESQVLRAHHAGAERFFTS